MSMKEDEGQNWIEDRCCVCCYFKQIENNRTFGLCIAPVPQWAGGNRGDIAVSALQDASLCECFRNVEKADGSMTKRYL